MSPINAATRAVLEGMSDSGADAKRDVYMETISIVVSFVVALLILAFVGQLLWNNVVVDLFSFARPAKSFLHIIGLMVFVNLVFPCM